VLPGETLCVVGPSGIGKSVLLKLIIGLYKPDRGKILVHGADLVPLGERALRRARRKIGMLFQGSALFDSLTVAETWPMGCASTSSGMKTRSARASANACSGWASRGASR